MLRPFRQLFGHGLGCMIRKSPRTARSFEQLESRSLLACMVMSTEGTLTITGDEQANTLEVEINPDGIRVNCDGETSAHPSAAALSVRTFGGDDRLIVGRQETTTEDWLVDTGPGKDVVDLRLGINLGGGLLGIVVRTGEDADRIVVNGAIAGDLDLSVLPGSGDNEVQIGLELGDPSHPLALDAFWGQLPPDHPPSTEAAPPELDVMFRPSSDNDVASGQVKLLGSRGRDDVRLDLNAAPGAGTDLDVTVNLREGDDRLAVNAAYDTELLSLSILPGSGRDAMTMSVHEYGHVLMNTQWTSYDPLMADASGDAAPAELEVMFKPGDSDVTSGQIKLVGSRGRDEVTVEMRSMLRVLNALENFMLRGGDDRLAITGAIAGNLDLSVEPGAGDNEVRVNMDYEVWNQPLAIDAVWTSHDPLMAEGSTDAAPAKLDVSFRPADADVSTAGQLKLLGSRGRDDVWLDLNAPSLTMTEVLVALREGDDRMALDAATAGSLDLSVMPGSGDNEVRLNWREKADVTGLFKMALDAV